MSTSTNLLPGVRFPGLPADYSWSTTDHLGNPDGDPKDEVFRKGERVLVAIHRNYRFGPFRFSIRVGRVKAYVVDPRAPEESLNEAVREVWESFQLRRASQSVWG
jgi:hypothetical protein